MTHSLLDPPHRDHPAHRPAYRRAGDPARRATIGVALVSFLGGLTACGSGQGGPHLALTAALPDRAPHGTVIRIGDPAAQAAMQASGLDKQLKADGVDVRWANLSGGPQTIQAFRGGKLDCGSVADIPSLFAAWTGTSTKIIFESVTVDPLKYPVYQLGLAPGVHVKTLADLKGKKIAYSPGQAQGALVLQVLRKAGLTKNDVKLVEITSVNDSYVTALGSHAVDVAPVGAANLKILEQKYPGSSSIKTGIRDDAATVYCLTSSVEDAHKAAALKDYVAVRTKALLWENTHPDEYAKAYYEDVMGLDAPDAKWSVEVGGTKGIPATWDNAIKRMQATADLLETEEGQKHLDVTTLVDRRFEKVETAAAGADVVKGGAS